jgi:hypothetical protein
MQYPLTRLLVHCAHCNRFILQNWLTCIVRVVVVVVDSLRHLSNACNHPLVCCCRSLYTHQICPATRNDLRPLSATSRHLVAVSSTLILPVRTGVLSRQNGVCRKVSRPRADLGVLSVASWLLGLNRRVAADEPVCDGPMRNCDTFRLGLYLLHRRVRNVAISGDAASSAVESRCDLLCCVSLLGADGGDATEPNELTMLARFSVPSAVAAPARFSLLLDDGERNDGAVLEPAASSNDVELVDVPDAAAVVGERIGETTVFCSVRSGLANCTWRKRSSNDSRLPPEKKIDGEKRSLLMGEQPGDLNRSGTSGDRTSLVLSLLRRIDGVRIVGDDGERNELSLSRKEFSPMPPNDQSFRSPKRSGEPHKNPMLVGVTGFRNDSSSASRSYGASRSSTLDVNLARLREPLLDSGEAIVMPRFLAALPGDVVAPAVLALMTRLRRVADFGDVVIAVVSVVVVDVARGEVHEASAVID